MFPDLTRDDVFRLETARLWLRWPRAADAQAIARLAGEKAVAEMTGTIPHPYPPDGAQPFILEARRGNAEGGRLTLAITRKGRDEAIGMIALVPASGSFENHGGLELGYWIGQPFWGQGYAPEAARALIDAAFQLTPVETICASARVINAASRRVVEKCGFTHVGSCLRAFPARGGALAVDRFELERDAWLAAALHRARRPASERTLTEAGPVALAVPRGRRAIERRLPDWSVEAVSA